MKIAIIGWGSLIWNPGTLAIDKKIGQEGWFSDGPMLPIEFSRISNKGRLTLVIDPNGKEVQVLYSISLSGVLFDAISNLAVREGNCDHKEIAFVIIKGRYYPSPKNFQFAEAIKSWIEGKKDIDAVIWTNLPEKLWYENDEKVKIDVERDDLVSYLNDLPPSKRALAEEYIRRAPKIIDTPTRKKIESELGWTRINLLNAE